VAKILIIDDSNMVLLGARLVLQEAGHEVVTNLGVTGAGGLVIAEDPDLIVLDVNMPELSGDKLLRPLRQNPRTAGIKVLFHSSESVEHLEHLVATTGADGYVRKARRFCTLAPAVEDLLEADAEDPEPARVCAEVRTH
jgi:DNA-binding response OmpR family regulator